VDPGPDYDRAAEEIRRATGAASVFQPDAEPDRLGARVSELLEDGLELTEAVELGLLNSPVLQASFHGVGMASADRVQAGLLTNPSLNAVLRFPTSGGGTGFEGALFGSLLDLWQVPDRERVAEQALEARILQLAHEAALLAAEIRVAYIETVTSRSLVEIAAQNRAIAENLVGLAEARLEAAATTAIDANLARLETSATAVALRDAELFSGEAARRLKALLGLPADLDLRLGQLPEPSSRALPPVEKLERIAVERRLDLRAASARASVNAVSCGRRSTWGSAPRRTATGAWGRAFVSSCRSSTRTRRRSPRLRRRFVAAPRSGRRSPSKRPGRCAPQRPGCAPPSILSRSTVTRSWRAPRRRSSKRGRATGSARRRSCP